MTRVERVRIVAVGLISIAAVCLASCQAPRDQVPVVIYLVDTLRADRLGLYGYARPTSPRLDQFAADSVIFEHAYAPSPWTLPSVASLLTSTFSCEHGVLAEGHILSAEIPTLAELLSRSGYFSGGYYHNLYVGPMAGLDRGYVRYQEWSGDGVADVRRLIQETAGRPFFYYFHTIEPHDPHTTPPSFVKPFGRADEAARRAYGKAVLTYSRLREVDWMLGRSVGQTDNTEEQDAAVRQLLEMQDLARVLYDGAVRRADSNFGSVLDVLVEEDRFDQSLIIFLSDHGEEFGEHGRWSHGQSTYEELMRVPLAIRFPGGQYGGQRITRPVSLVDIVPTIMDLVGRTGECDSCRGRSLLPLVQRLEPGDVNPAEPEMYGMRSNRQRYYRPAKRQRGDLNLLLRLESFKGIWNHEVGRLELYDLLADSGEQQDVADENPTVASRLAERGRTLLAECETQSKTPDEAPPLDERTREILRSMGYFN